jgi:hypothetical protein
MIPIVDVSDTPPASGNTKRISINNILSSSPTASGALTVTGLVTAGSATITGAATVGTTLGVTGASTLASVGVTGAATVGTTLLVGTNATLTNGNVIIGTSGKGIDFSATANSSGTMTSELLADYEEGTWTPVFVGTSSNGTYVYSTQVGRYTKVGNLVTVFGHLVISSITTAATGIMRIGGLPFTTSSVNVYAAATVGWTEFITISSGTLVLAVNTGGVVIDMYRILSGAGVGYINPSDLVVNTRINFTATYFV